MIYLVKQCLLIAYGSWKGLVLGMVGYVVGWVGIMDDGGEETGGMFVSSDII